jgi:hypothetical protein
MQLRGGGFSNPLTLRRIQIVNGLQQPRGFPVHGPRPKPGKATAASQAFNISVLLALQAD